MAMYDVAYRITMGHEGGYSNDPVDTGGETYKGISRKHHPSWEGWDIVDGLKGDGFPSNCYNNSDLELACMNFYKSEFWDKFWGDKQVGQFIAEELFDTSVNMGVGRAIKFLQQGLNLLNRNGTSWKDIAEDGGYGPNTHATLETCVSKGDARYLYNVLNILQGSFYLEIMRNSPSQERFARGWLNRVDIQKK